MLALHENPNHIHTELTFINLKAHNHKMYVFLSSTQIVEASQTNSVGPDQTAPTAAPDGAV